MKPTRQIPSSNPRDLRVLVSNGAAAHREITDSTWGRALVKMREEHLELIAGSDPTDHAGRHESYCMVRAIDRLTQELTRVVSGGKLALERIENQQFQERQQRNARAWSGEPER